MYAHTVSGYLSIPIDSTKNALIPFTAPITVGTATASATAQVPMTQVLSRGGIRAFHFTPGGISLNYTGTGLTSGTFVFYYGTPFPGSVPLADLSAIAASFGTDTTDTFTFPGGPVALRGIILIFGTSASQTNLQIRVDWATGSGRSVFVTFSEATVSEVLPLDNLEAASSLTVTYTYSGTHVGTGYLIIYYKL